MAKTSKHDTKEKIQIRQKRTKRKKRREKKLLLKNENVFKQRHSWSSLFIGKH